MRPTMPAFPRALLRNGFGAGGPTLAEVGERALLERLIEIAEAGSGPAGEDRNGDDAAVWRPPHAGARSSAETSAPSTGRWSSMCASPAASRPAVRCAGPRVARATSSWSAGCSVAPPPALV